jgi:hypothetical protein
VEFGLRFESQESDDADDPAPEAPMEEMVEPDTDKSDSPREAEVVSLDKFRK